MVGNIGSDIKTETAEKVGQTGNAQAADNVAAEVESFHQQIADTKAHAAATAGEIGPGDSRIAQGEQLVAEGTQELDDGSALGDVMSALPDAAADTFEEVPVLGDVTGFVADVAQGVGDMVTDVVEGVAGLFGFGGEEEPPPPPPPPPANVAGAEVPGATPPFNPEATDAETEEIGNPEDKIALGNQLIEEGKALNDAEQA